MHRYWNSLFQPACEITTAKVIVEVGNEPPKVDTGLDATIFEGSAFTRVGRFTDPDEDDSWTQQWTMGVAWASRR